MTRNSIYTMYRIREIRKWARRNQKENETREREREGEREENEESVIIKKIRNNSE